MIPSYKLGYNTNGFKQHPLEITIEILAEIGYRCVAISLDYFKLNPWDRDLDRQLERVAALLTRHTMTCVIETGANYLLDPRCKHAPTLIAPTRAERHRRIEFTRHAVDIAATLNAGAVSFWAGRPDVDTDLREAWSWLISGCQVLCAHAAERGVELAFEPEPGMLVENLTQFRRLQTAVDHPRFGLTLDLGHAHLTEPDPLEIVIEQSIDAIRNIHIEDMRRPRHEHLMFGDGEMKFGPVFKALAAHRYTGPVCVELSRHSHDAINTARRAYTFLTASTCQIPPK